MPLEDFTRKYIEIDNQFTYHPPKGDQTDRYQKLREAARALAHLIVDHTPESPEQDQALFLLNLAVMSANAAIARRE